MMVNLIDLERIDTPIDLGELSSEELQRLQQRLQGPQPRARVTGESLGCYVAEDPFEIKSATMAIANGIPGSRGLFQVAGLRLPFEGSDGIGLFSEPVSEVCFNELSPEEIVDGLGDPVSDLPPEVVALGPGSVEHMFAATMFAGKLVNAPVPGVADIATRFAAIGGLSGLLVNPLTTPALLAGNSVSVETMTKGGFVTATNRYTIDVFVKGSFAQGGGSSPLVDLVVALGALALGKKCPDSKPLEVSLDLGLKFTCFALKGTPMATPGDAFVDTTINLRGSQSVTSQLCDIVNGLRGLT